MVARWWLVALVLSAAIAMEGRPTAVAAEPTREDLKRAILALDDVGPEFELRREGPISTTAIDYHVYYMTRRAPIQQVSAQLTVISTSILNVDLEVGAVVSVYTEPRLGWNVTARPAPPPALGANTSRYLFSGSYRGMPLSGEVIGWEWNGIRAVVFAFGMGNPTALPYAQRQQQRLEAVFGPQLPPSPTPTGAAAPSTVVQTVPSFPEGAFVQAQDGSTWVTAGGRRLGITWTEDETNVVPDLPRGPSVSTAAQLAAALAAASGASGADRELPFADGSFVRAQDGSRWVVSRGRRYAITFLPDGENVIPSLPIGPSVSTADQLATELGTPAAGVASTEAGSPAGSSASTSDGGTQAPQPVAVDPVQTLVGQTITICKFSVQFRGTIERAESQSTLMGISTSGIWVVVIVSVTNIGNKSESLSNSVQLRDERGRLFDMANSTNSGLYYTDLARLYGVRSPYSDVQPGLSTRTIFAFQVAPDVQRLEMVSANLGCR